MKKKISQNNIILFFTLLIFIIAELLICPHHEHFCDEAQAWMLARDTSFLELVTHYIRYEGSPALWHIILKIFIFFKLPYSLFYIIPIIFSSIGVGIFLFKSKFPMWIKVCIPFTYYIFYQYTVVARSYCLMLPFLAAIAAIYPRKTEKPYLFCALLLLYANISVHTIISAGAIFGLYLIDLYKQNKNNSLPKNLLISNLISSSLIIAGLGLTIFYSRLASDFIFPAHVNLTLDGLIHARAILGTSLIFNYPNIITDFIGIIFFIGFVLSFYKKSWKILEFMVIFLPVYLFLSLIHCFPQHLGIIFLLLLFAFWIHFDESKYRFKTNKTFYILFAFVLFIQTIWTFDSVYFDLKKDYSGANKVAEYIKQQMKNGKKKIYGYGFEIVGLEPFFDKNIYNNTEKTFYIWSSNNKKIYTNKLFEGSPDIVVLPFSTIEGHSFSMNQNLYDTQIFAGDIFVKNRKFKNDSFLVFTKK